MAERQPLTESREFRIARYDPRLILWSGPASISVNLSFDLMHLPKDGLFLWAKAFLFLSAMVVPLALAAQRVTCLLSSEGLTIGRGKSAVVLPIHCLMVAVDDKKGSISFQSADGRINRVYRFGTPDTGRLLEALKRAGSLVTGWKTGFQVQAGEDFELESELTHSMNWRWQDCQIPELALDVTIGSSSSQTVKASEGRLSLLRKGREVASFSLKELTLVRQFKKVEPDTARLVLMVGKRDLWPLSDWNSPVEGQLHSALTANGVPFEEQAWVRKQEAYSTW